MLINPPNWKVAALFAKAWHGDQKRKYTGEPYIVHCQEVADMIERLPAFEYPLGRREETICAAWLHDVLEDTKASRTDIEVLFGSRVMHLVLQLTNVEQWQGNRKARYVMNVARLKDASDDAQTIKLADLISNTSTIVQHDPAFAPLYLDEKEGLLAVLTRGNTILRERARQTLNNAREELKNHANANAA